MKKKVLIISLLASTFSFGQSLTQANEPTIGQSVTMYVCDTATSSLSSTFGNNVTWDYSTIASDAGATSVLEITSPSQTTNGPVFPNSTKAISFQGALLNYISSTPTQRLSQGFVFSDATLGDVIVDLNSNPEKIVAYPFALGNSVSDNFAGNVSFTFNGTLQNPTCTGSSLAKIDGQGTLKLPSSTNLTNVIRYKLVDTIFTQVTILPPPFPASDIEIIRNQYEYYDITNSTMPAFVYATITVLQAGATAPLINQKNILSSVQPNYTASLTNLDSEDFVLYPNPSNGTMQLKGDFNGTISVTITDQAGRVVYANQSMQKGDSIVLNSLKKGVYNALISYDTAFINKKMIIE